MSFEEKYKKEIDAIAFSPDYENRLKSSIQAKKNKDTASVSKKRKAIGLLAAVITVAVIMSVTTAAEPSSHTPDATTVQFQSSVTDFGDRWKKGKRFPYESGDEEYAFTVLGTASGTFLTGCDGFTADEDREYFITAIRGHDGTDLSLESGSFPVKITPLIYGREPWAVNSSTLCEDVRVAEKNGVIYYLFDTSFLRAFPGRIICFASYEGDVPSPEIFTMNENGTISFSEKYEGFGRIIEIPQDMSDTHPEAAEKILLNDELSKLY
ncbi:MAG: hypothetical protein IJN88_00300 [Clostridia bacterium]|nr:hypothetical protein [Clostridia bacterium]